MATTQPGAGSATYPLSGEGLVAAGLPQFVIDKIRRVAQEYRIARFQLGAHAVQGERVTLWSENAPTLWFCLGGSATWANIDGAYTTFDRIPEAFRPPTSSPDELWWLRLAGETEPYALEVAHLTLRWGEVKGTR